MGGREWVEKVFQAEGMVCARAGGQGMPISQWPE